MSEPIAGPEPDPAALLLRRLTGSLAHNLNNRLMGAIGCLEWALQEVPGDSPLATRLQEGLTCTLQAAEMMRRMITFACGPAGWPNPGLVSLGEVADHVAGRLRDQRRTGLSVEVIHSSTAPARANAVLVQLALDQLVANAVDAMPDGGVLVLRIFRDGPHACLAVSDTGPGLAEQVASHLFEPFRTTRTAGHLGLGLVLCRDLVQGQGGSVNLAWESGRGTIATLRFPAQQEGEPLPPAPAGSPSSSSDTLWHVI